MDFSSFDYVIHCGDYGNSKLENGIVVCGNCDIYGEKERMEMIAQRKVYVTHGDLYQVKYGYDRLCYRAMEVGADVCLFGHTHRSDCFYENGILFLNAGAYENGEYAIIEDKEITFYCRDKKVKKIQFEW